MDKVSHGDKELKEEEQKKKEVPQGEAEGERGYWELVHYPQYY